jgi:hypothetical protein
MSLDYWKERFQTADPNKYHQFRNKNPDKKDQMATAALYKARQPNNENFADGRHPEDKGDSKRYGVPTKASVSTLRKVAKQGGRKGQLAHWMANMKAGRAKKD